MLMTVFSRLAEFFGNTKPAAPAAEDGFAPRAKFRVAVVDFLDNVESIGGENTAQILREFPDFEVLFLDEPFNKNFLNLESRTLFDLLDKGQALLDKTEADVLIWGCRENNKIRLNFQTDRQYEKDDNTFVSLLDSLYLPTELFNAPQNFPSAVKTLLHGAVISAVSPTDNNMRIHRRYLLKKDIRLLSRDNSAKRLAVSYMPYIMNFLGIIYLSYAFDSDDGKDFKVTSMLFATAIKHQDLIDSSLHLGCIYYHLGQLNDCAGRYQNKRLSRYFKDAVSNYRQAQRYLGKYTYPYDYGCISYKLSHLFFNYWKQKEDIQALRDAVSQLREVEKIFSYSQFPEFWASVQGELGYLLSLLGSITKSSDICQLAINCYRNQQKIITEKRDPLIWASTQESIGSINYKLGAEHSSRVHLEDALECFHDALYIYENISRADKIKQMLTAIARTDNELRAL